MRTRRRHADPTGLLPFPPAAATAAIPRPRPLPAPMPRPVLRQLVSELRPPIAQASALVRSRRFGFYLDILGATLFMALFVAAAILA